MIRQGLAEVFQSHGMLYMYSEIVFKTKRKKEWLDPRISSKPLMYCIVKIESILKLFYSPSPTPNPGANDVSFLQIGH